MIIHGNSLKWYPPHIKQSRVYPIYPMYNWTNTKNTNHEIVWTSIPKQFLNATDHLVSPKKYHWAILVHFHCHKPFRCLSPHFCGLKTLNSSSGYGASASDAKPQSDWLHLLVHLSHGDGCPFNWCWGHRVPVSHHPPKKWRYWETTE